MQQLCNEGIYFNFDIELRIDSTESPYGIYLTWEGATSVNWTNSPPFINVPTSPPLVVWSSGDMVGQALSTADSPAPTADDLSREQQIQTK